jgi:hypothetical protein
LFVDRILLLGAEQPFMGRQPVRLHAAIRVALSQSRAKLLCALAVVMFASTDTSIAHHSGSMWDSSRTVTLEGMVKEFQWSNPHCWIQLLITQAGAAANDAQEWSIEMAAPIQVRQGGWKPGTLKAGDRIRVNIHPAHDGSRAGNFVSAVSADGRPLGTT